MDLKNDIKYCSTWNTSGVFLRMVLNISSYNTRNVTKLCLLLWIGYVQNILNLMQKQESEILDNKKSVDYKNIFKKEDKMEFQIIGQENDSD